MAGKIDAKISPTATTSPAVSGSSLLRPGSKAQNSLITAQIIPDDPDADFEVELEGAVNSTGVVTFAMIGFWDQDEETLVTIFPISEGCLYRFVHVSGEPCTVRLTG